jgi:hypothetical protein
MTIYKNIREYVVFIKRFGVTFTDIDRYAAMQKASAFIGERHAA